MSYNDKYIAQFYTFPREEVITVKIQGENYSGSIETLTLAEDAVTITLPTKKELYGQIMGMGCQIRVINTETLIYFDNLFATSEKAHKVVIIEEQGTANEITLFEGFIQPAIHRQAITQKSRIIIPADNQLSNLHNYYSQYLESEFEFSTVNLYVLMKDILDTTGLELPIYIKNTLFSKLYAEAFDVTDTCFDKLRVNRQVFVENDEIMNGRNVLEHILKVTYSRLYYYDKKWVIDRLRDVHETNQYKAYPQSGSASIQQLLHDSFELSDQHIVIGSAGLEYTSGKKEYEIIINFDKYDNLVASNFIHIQQQTVIPTTLKGMLPKPSLGFWQTWRGLDVFNHSLTTEHLTSGIAHTKGDLTVNEYYNTPVTSSFMLDFIAGYNCIIKCTYDYSLAYVDDLRDHRGGFRLRYQDNNNNWRFLTFIDGVIKLNARFSNDVNVIDFSNLAENDYVLQWGPYRIVSGSTRYIWRIRKAGVTVWETSTEWISNAPVYGTHVMESNNSAFANMTINDETVDEYSLFLGRADWTTNVAGEDERVAGFYKYSHTEAVGYREFKKVSLASVYEIDGVTAKNTPAQKISEVLEYDEISSWVTSDLGYTPEVLEMYIDMMPMHRRIPPAEDNDWTPLYLERSYFGDIVIEQNNEISNNVITGVLNTDFRDILRERLIMYDGDFVNYKNTLMLLDSSSELVKSRDWSDAYEQSGDIPQKIHYLLIRDLAQQYNEPRHGIKADIILDKDSVKHVSPGSVFTFTHLTDKKFIVIGYDYNVKMRAYRITLFEHKDYADFEIIS